MAKDDAQPAAETTSPEPSQPAATYAVFAAKYEKTVGELKHPAKIRANHYGKVAKKPDSDTIEFAGYRIDLKLLGDAIKKELKETSREDQIEMLACIGDPKCSEKIRAIEKRHEENFTKITSHEHGFLKSMWLGRWTECEYKISDIETSDYTELDPDEKAHKKIIEDIQAAEGVNEYKKSLNNKVE